MIEREDGSQIGLSHEVENCTKLRGGRSGEGEKSLQISRRICSRAQIYGLLYEVVIPPPPPFARLPLLPTRGKVEGHATPTYARLFTTTAARILPCSI